MTRTLLAFVSIFAATALGRAMEPEGRIGDLAYDTARWQVSEIGGAYHVRCRETHCDESAFSVRVAPGEATGCTAAAMMSAENALAETSRDPRLRTIERPGLTIHAVTSWTGCRNARPPSVHACTAYKGRIYRFDAAVMGCRGGPGFNAGALDFLSEVNAR